MLPSDMPRLSQGAVVLRAFEDRDVALVQSVADDPLIPLITTVPSSGTRDDALAYIARQHDRLTTGAGYSFAIADLATDRAVGSIGLWLRDVDEGRASTGYWVAPDFRRRGYVATALQALTSWALSLDGIDRVQLYVEPWNEGSWRAAESCAYQREGLLRSWQKIGDERKDMYMYSVLRPKH
ncbi:GNAT family N-acetyltransferase [Ornithinimicrobium cryptoxanthini]|uniref:GNAT family N-acetyltransferase n=1 Tax=Ornithinimicrobium cryptoxanthini TaxID=2934161 RepID=A0ABY4YI41_9MICO|nr:GNAT family protein [Ornithinimicrobium cryptoxanthini]USQ76292.1 GNAT family N-acetyltransferase [Ornithinimicrobium cryptoxanthini]